MSMEDEVPLPSSLQDSIDAYSDAQESSGINSEVSSGASRDSTQPLLGKKGAPIDYPVIVEKVQDILTEKNRQKITGWTIMFTCIGAFILTYAASSLRLPSSLRFSLCGVGGTFLLSGLIVLTCIDQDERRHKFGHAGDVPLSSLKRRGCVWLIVGVLVYVFYGRTHSSLLDAVYLPAAHADEIYRSSGDSLA